MNTLVANNIAKLKNVQSLDYGVDSCEMKVLNGKEISKESFSETLTVDKRRLLGIDFNIFKIYTYCDMSGVHYLVFTENLLEDYGDKKIVDKIKLFNLVETKDYDLQQYWIAKDFINDSENSIWFWTKYLSLEDLDGDKLIDPIIVYGSSTPLSYLDYGRVKILIYYKGKKVAIRHQDSDFDEERYTQIDEAFFKLPLEIKKAVYEKMMLMEDRGHAIFNSKTKYKIEETIGYR